jgi:FkbM family methyltransferase
MGTQQTRSAERVDTERTKIEESKRAIDTLNGKQKMSFLVREGTTDSKVIDEIIDRRTYQHKRLGFDIVASDVWLDLGANIGIFSCFVIARGGKVYGYEPEKNNFEILKENIKRTKSEYGASRRLSNLAQQKEGKVFREGVSTTTGIVKLYLTKNPENKYRHTIIPKKGRDTVTIKVKSMDDILKEHSDINAVKMDIEGIEIDILENFNGWKKYGIAKLVLEYSFDIDPSIPRFAKIINNLKKYYKTVHFTKVDLTQKEYRFFPPQTIVFCMDLR